MEKLKLKGFVHPSVHVDQANVAVKMGAPKRDKIMCVVLLQGENECVQYCYVLIGNKSEVSTTNKRKAASCLDFGLSQKLVSACQSHENDEDDDDDAK